MNISSSLLTGTCSHLCSCQCQRYTSALKAFSGIQTFQERTLFCQTVYGPESSLIGKQDSIISLYGSRIVFALPAFCVRLGERYRARWNPGDTSYSWDIFHFSLHVLLFLERCPKWLQLVRSGACHQPCSFIFYILNSCCICKAMEYCIDTETTLYHFTEKYSGIE